VLYVLIYLLSVGNHQVVGWKTATATTTTTTNIVFCITGQLFQNVEKCYNPRFSLKPEDFTWLNI